MDQAPLTRLIHRLEAATSRLEDIASSTQPFDGPSNGHHAGPSDGSSLTVPSHNQRALQTPGGSSTGGSQTQEQEPMPEFIDDFDTLIHGDLKAYNDLSQTMGGVIEEQVSSVRCTVDRLLM